jgi:hypothetical protein
MGWTILLYDNPESHFDTNMPKERHYKLIDQFCMKHITKEVPGPTYPQFWHYRHGIDLLMSTKAEYILTIGADSVFERPEGLQEIINLLGDGDIISCSTKTDKHGGPFCGTKSFLARKQSFYKLVNYLQELWVPFRDIGNMETRFGMAVKDLKLKEIVAPKMPSHDQFAYSYNEIGECTERGTWGEILGFRHLAGEHKIRKTKKQIPVEEKYYDLNYLSKFEKEIFSQYWETKNKDLLERWWSS